MASAGVSGKNEPMTASDDSQSTTDATQEATKRKFREALKAKKGRQGEAHVDSDQANVHAHGPVESKRVFRRKTG